MINRRLKKELNKIEVPMYDISKYEETIRKAKKVKLHPEKLRMSNIEFFCDQLRFIKKQTWVLKTFFSVLMLLLIFTEHMETSNWIWTLAAIAGPVLCLINANEICNIFQPGMLEIQMTAKNSFSRVLIVRLLTFGLIDLVFFVVMAVGISIYKDTAIWQVILYGIVPYVIMCFGCMLILNRCREKYMSLYIETWGVCLCCAIMIVKITDMKIYQTAYFSIWLCTGIIALAGTIIEVRKLFIRTGGNLNAINYGTSL
ncbi:hypothetical protein [Schaedlerella arabinosiphila]|jgi:hypothetical protein|uniref:hypothetical protein n=1 Tax=Schaedlerella arabinosiphila TaxID=2044587 RepID=UPI000F63F109|nr:hypothetical protein [Schaedlerella arabinosiphila]